MKQEGTHNTMMNNPTLMTCPVTAKAIKTRPHATNAVVDTTAAGAMNPHVTYVVVIDNTQALVAPTVTATTNKTASTLSPLPLPPTTVAPTPVDVNQSKEPPDSPRKNVGSHYHANLTRKQFHLTEITSMNASRPFCKKDAFQSSPTSKKRTNSMLYNALTLRRTAPRTGSYNSHQQRATPNRRVVAPSPYMLHVGQ